MQAALLHNKSHIFTRSLPPSNPASHTWYRLRTQRDWAYVRISAILPLFRIRKDVHMPFAPEKAIADSTVAASQNGSAGNIAAVIEGHVEIVA